MPADNIRDDQIAQGRAAQKTKHLLDERIFAAGFLFGNFEADVNYQSKEQRADQDQLRIVRILDIDQRLDDIAFAPQHRK